MIVTFGDKSTEAVYHGFDSKGARAIAQTIWRVARRKLDMLDAAASVNDLKAPPANRLEVLKGGLKGKCSIRINDQYRLVFAFKDGNAYEVEITDYH